MMNTQLSHAVINKPAAQPMSGAYWFEITRGDSNHELGSYRI
jgi:hypothetical protein